MKSTMNKNDTEIKFFHNQEFGKEKTEVSFSGFFVEMARNDYPADYDMKVFVKSNVWYNFYDLCRIVFENVIDKNNLIKHFQSIQSEKNQSEALLQNPESQNPERSKSRMTQNPECLKSRTTQNPEYSKSRMTQNPECSKSRMLKIPNSQNPECSKSRITENSKTKY